MTVILGILPDRGDIVFTQARRRPKLAGNAAVGLRIVGDASLGRI
jgi:hypothetical protein